MGVLDQHPRLAEIEAERRAMFGKIRTAQQAYRQQYGRFLQLPLSQATDRDGDSLAALDRARKVDDEPFNWSRIVSADDVADGVRCQYYVHRYDGPQGKGAILGCRIVYKGREFRFEQHYGPEQRSGPFGRWVEVVLDGE